MRLTLDFGMCTYHHFLVREQRYCRALCLFSIQVWLGSLFMVLVPYAYLLRSYSSLFSRFASKGLQ